MAKWMVRKKVISVIVLLLIVFILGAVLPYAWQPKVSRNMTEQFQPDDFYGASETGERACIISDNETALEERIRLISQAEKRIILSTFEFDADESGKDVLSALMAAAERGVEVSVIADGFPGVLQFPGNPYFHAFTGTPGVEMKVYNPVRVWKPWTLMGRLHDKYLIVDDSTYLLGGRNTYDFFLGEGTGYQNYDWDVLVWCKEKEEGAAGVLENKSVGQLLNYFDSVWYHPESKRFYSRFRQKLSSVSKAEEELKTRYAGLQKEHPDWFEACDYEEKTFPVNQIRLLSNPVQTGVKEPVVFYQMTELMKSAREEVRFHTPYIICNDWMLERLKEVCQSVDSVQMMTNSVANNGNPFGAMDYQYHKQKILDTGVEILEYDGGVSYHGKCFAIDDRLSGIGSFNWDMRSAYLDTELMLVLDSEGLNRQLREVMKQYEKESLKVRKDGTVRIPDGLEPQQMGKKKEWMLKVLHWIGGWARFLM
ncbi:MAG: phospholipase D family protein [Lachnospiraceae bacterium]|nr:phospholipase D family protein [Lachnospiraceae bacterium]